MIEGFFIDGYIELQNESTGLPYRVGFEYFGCRFHRCEWGCLQSVQTDEEFARDLRRLEILTKHLDEIKIIRSCQWLKLRKLVKYDAILSSFIGKNFISQDMLITAVRLGLIYNKIIYYGQIIVI